MKNSSRPERLAFHSFVKRRIKGVEIFAVEVLLRDAEGVAEALVVHNLTLTQILDGIAHIGIIAQTQNIIVGYTSFLLCYYHVFATKISFAKVRKILMLQGISAPFARSKRQAVCPSGFDCARPCHSEWSEAESNRSVAEAR